MNLSFPLFPTHPPGKSLYSGTPSYYPTDEMTPTITKPDNGVRSKHPESEGASSALGRSYGDLLNSSVWSGGKAPARAASETNDDNSNILMGLIKLSRSTMQYIQSLILQRVNELISHATSIAIHVNRKIKRKRKASVQLTRDNIIHALVLHPWIIRHTSIPKTSDFISYSITEEFVIYCSKYVQMAAASSAKRLVTLSQV